MLRRTLASLVLLFAGIAAAESKPVVRQYQTIPAASDLRQLWHEAGIIALVRITESSVGGIPPSNPRFLPIVYTEHTAEVLEVFKGNADKRAALRFHQAAGSLELPDKIVQVPGREPLEIGGTYFVFLTAIPDGFALASDLEGAFRTDKGVLIPQGFGPLAVQHRNMPERQFIRELSYIAR